MLTVGLLFILGEQALFELVDAIQTTSLAASEKELDDGAEHLARTISMVGVAAFVGWLSRFLPKGRGAGKARETAPAVEEPPAKTSPSKETSPKAQEPYAREEAPTQPKPVVKGVTAAELGLAASEGNSSAQVAARKKVAEGFYREHTKYTDAEIRDHLRAVDFRKPVKARKTPPPDTAVSWQVPGIKGNYYANPGTKPAELGIGGLGLEPGPAPRRVVEKVPTLYKIEPGTPVLESTAAKVVDKWSVRAGGAAGAPGTVGFHGVQQETTGDATQFFLPDKGAASTAP